MKTLEFKKALTKLDKVVGKKASLPVVASVLIKQTEDRLVITATNLDAYMELFLEEVGDPFSVCVDYMNLKRLVGKLKGKEISFSYEKEWETWTDNEEKEHTRTEEILIINAGKATYRIKGIEAQEFPLIPCCENLLAKMPAERFFNEIQFALSSANTDDTRPVLQGIFLETLEGTDLIYMAGTDGFRINQCYHLYDVKEQFQILVAPEVINLKYATGEVSMYNGKTTNHVRFVWGDGTLTVMEIDGNFPDYRAIFPKEVQFVFSANAKEMAEACESAGIIANEAGTGTVKLSISKSNELKMSATSEEMGDVSVTVAIQTDQLEQFLDYLGGEGESKEEFEVAFCWEFLKECIQVGEKVNFGLNANDKPMIMYNAEDSFKQSLRKIVLMPMHLG